MTLVLLLTVLSFLTVSVSESLGLESHCLQSAVPSSCKYCEPGWYGELCNKTCINCDSLGCEKSTGNCFSCKHGYYSEGCLIPCPMNCKDHQCERDSGHCRNCKHGWWGKKCYQPCSENCMDTSCFFFEGSCIYGCTDGWTGRTCSDPCPKGCSKCTLDGTCINECEKGYYGDNCEKRCNGNCVDDDCIFDFVYNETVCRSDCVEGWMSYSCDKPCWTNCITCYQFSGDCSTCRHGFWGPRCTNLCNSTCVDSLCSIHGYCTNGCKSGYYGRLCDQECDTNCRTCNRTSGQCLVCKPGFSCMGREMDDQETPDKTGIADGDIWEQKTVITVGALFVTAVVALTMVTVIVVSCRKRKGNNGQNLTVTKHKEQT